MRTILQKLFRITVPSFLFLILFLEFIVFRLILPASEWPYRRSITKDDNVVRYIYSEAPMYARGVGRLGFPERYAAHYTINHEGWNSTKEYSLQKTGKKRIAVIGDSFVDALQVDVDKCFAELLEKKLNQDRQTPVEVYRFGFGNAALSQYLNILRYVSKKFDPDIVIVSVQANDFVTSFPGSWNEDGDFLLFSRNGDKWEEIAPVPYEPSKFRLMIKRSALFRYLYGNLEFRYRTFRLGSLFRKSAPGRTFQMNVDIGKNLFQIPLFYDLSIHILNLMKSAMPAGAKLILFMDADRDALYRGLDPKREKSYELVQMFAKACKNSNVPFLELSDAFTADYKRFHQRFDYDIDRHWNERGHQIVADTIFEYFTKNRLLE